MTRKTAFLLTLLFLFTAQACTIQGLPYPTATPDPNLITPDLKATREMTEAGMFPSSTPDPQPSRTSESLPTATPLDDSSLNHMPSLKVAYIVDGDVWYWELGQTPLQLTTSGDAVDVILSDDWSQAAFMRQIDQYRQALWVVNTD